MDGFMFFWFSWATWIYSTFILSTKNQYRFITAFSILLVIILSIHTISIYHYEISLAAIYILLISFIYFRKLEFLQLLYVLIRVMILCISGATFYIMSIYDPVWLIFDVHWIQAILFTFLSVLLFERFLDRMVSLLMSLIYADMIFSFVLNGMGINHTIGALQFMDGLCVTILTLTIWYTVELIQNTYMKQQQVEREKQI